MPKRGLQATALEPRREDVGASVWYRSQAGLFPSTHRSHSLNTGDVHPCTFDKGEELGRFVREVAERVSLRSPNDVAQYLLTKVYVPFEDFDQEEMWVLLLDSKLRITHEVMVYRGQVGQISIREAELLKEAIRVNAPSLILSHCHPTGDPTPSPEDVRVTAQIDKAANLLGLDLLDHIVVGKDSCGYRDIGQLLREGHWARFSSDQSKEKPPVFITRGGS